MAGRTRPGSAGRPTVADLDYHLTTLFPPVRPRGYLEIRCIDALPDRWWPALAALTVTLVDDPSRPTGPRAVPSRCAQRVEAAAREGLADPGAARAAATGCVEVAARAAARRPWPPTWRRSPSWSPTGARPATSCATAPRRDGPLRLLEEEAHA